jgi:hypothetical protein
MVATEHPALSPATLRALAGEATRRSSVGWLRYGALDRDRPFWYVWHDGAAYLVAAAAPDSPEQVVPGLTEVATAQVICRAKDSRARLVTWTAAVTVLPPGSPEWDAAVRLLRSDRLNAAHAAGLPEQWSASAAVVRLDPTGEVLEGPGQMPDEDGAAPPPDTPASTAGRRPFVVHRRKRRRPRLS